MNLSVPDVLHNLRKTGNLSPAALDMIKLVALLAMLIDHINTVFLTPAQSMMYALRRMAFSLFTLIWAMNVRHSPERLQLRANRQWVWATITQPVFSLAFQHHQPWWALNILFVFLICINGVTYLLSMPAETLLLATLPTLVFPLVVVSFCRDLCPEGRKRFMPRNFFYYAYAGHLGIIGLIQSTFG